MTRREFLTGGVAFALLSSRRFAAQPPATSKLQFNGTDYLFRWTNGRLFEFTPQGQEDLDKWTEMVSIVALTGVNSPEKLTGWASNLVEQYRSHHGLLRANSIPATAQDPAQYFVGGILLANGVAECVFNRFLLIREIGYNLIYSHRNYGADMKQTIQQASDWTKANGAAIETAIMKYTGLPDLETLQHMTQTNAPQAR